MEVLRLQHVLLVGLLLANVTSQSDNTTRPDNPCEDGWLFFPPDDLCYVYKDICVTWLDAVTLCQEVGARLIHVNVYFVQEFLHRHVVDDGYESIWIGGSDRLERGIWRWVSNNTIIDSYTAWLSGYPSNNTEENEQCIVDFKDGLDGWTHTDCNVTHKFVCEKVGDENYKYLWRYCVEIRAAGGYRWNDIDCDVENIFVCEERSHNVDVSLYEGQPVSYVSGFLTVRRSYGSCNKTT